MDNAVLRMHRLFCALGKTEGEFVSFEDGKTIPWTYKRINDNEFQFGKSGDSLNTYTTIDNGRLPVVRGMFQMRAN